MSGSLGAGQVLTEAGKREKAPDSALKLPPPGPGEGGWWGSTPERARALSHTVESSLAAQALNAGRGRPPSGQSPVAP